MPRLADKARLKLNLQSRDFDEFECLGLPNCFASLEIAKWTERVELYYLLG